MMNLDMGVEGSPEKLSFPKINRRTALKICATGAALAWGLRLKFPPEPAPAMPDLVTGVTGIIPNCRHLPYKPPEVQEQLIKNIKDYGGGCARVFLDDRFERRLGDYQHEPLDQIKRISRVMPVTVDIWDAVQAKGEFTRSPYLGSDDGRSLSQRRFSILTDNQIKDALLKRTATVVNELKGEFGVKGWCLGNESDFKGPEFYQMAKASGKSLKALHTELFEAQIQTILGLDSSRPIVIGVEDPNIVDEEKLVRFSDVVYNSIHVYEYSEGIIDRYLKEDHYLGLLAQEVARSRRAEVGELSWEEYDIRLSSFYEKTLERLHPNIISWGPWQIIAQGEQEVDGYEILPDKLPKSRETVQQISEVLAAIPANNAV